MDKWDIDQVTFFYLNIISDNFLPNPGSHLAGYSVYIYIRPIARMFERGVPFMGGGGGGGGGWEVTKFSLTIHKISNMYHHLVTHPLPLIVLPNESLVEILSNDMLHDVFKCLTFSSIIVKYHTNFTKYS